MKTNNHEFKQLIESLELRNKDIADNKEYSKIVNELGLIDIKPTLSFLESTQLKGGFKK